MKHIDNLDRRLNYIDAQLDEVHDRINLVKRELSWPEFAIVPYLKQRARLRREHEHVTALKNKRESERKLKRLERKFNERRH